jgi:parallel beta-helix repeat protein
MGNGYQGTSFGGDFGIGLFSSDNVVEDNTASGNSNGIIVGSGVQGNVVSRNLVVGNPAVQVSVDHPPIAGFDIKNLADAGANTFEGNVCVTSVNAPCPSIGPSLTATPNPIPVTGSAFVGSTTLSWNAPDAQVIEIHIGSPNGKLFTQYGNRGSMQTGTWVPDGMTFFLQDVTGGKPLTSDYTLATLVVHLQASSAAYFHLPGGPHQWAFGASAMLFALTLCGFVVMQSGSRARRVRAALGGAVLLAGVGFSLSQTKALAQRNQTPSSSPSSQASAQQTADTLDRMIAAGKSPRDLAQYLFDTHGCKDCHTIGQQGKLGFTQKGEERAKGFEGCISTLKAMSIIAKVPEDQRSATQIRRVQRFEEFGCAKCHKLASAKMGLTEVGARLAHLHLGCVEVEKLVASGTTSRR